MRPTQSPRAFEYWRNIDKEIGNRIAKGVKGG
jgi:catalase